MAKDEGANPMSNNQAQELIAQPAPNSSQIALRETNKLRNALTCPSKGFRDPAGQTDPDGTDDERALELNI
jgi:hypothetical protein